MVYQVGLPVSWAKFLADQWEEYQVRTGNPSAYSPEDLVSNWLGRTFATNMLQEDRERYTEFMHSIVPYTSRPYNRVAAASSMFFDIAQQWEVFLKETGAIKLGSLPNGEQVTDLLKAECQRFLENSAQDAEAMRQLGSSIGGCLAYHKSQPEWKCLCDGDTPKYEELRC